MEEKDDTTKKSGSIFMEKELGVGEGKDARGIGIMKRKLFSI